MGFFGAIRRKSFFSIYLVLSYLVISGVWTIFYVGVVAGQPTHDIAITSVTTNTTVVAPGEAVNVTVLIENQGDFSETFNVSAYYNSSLIGTQNDVSLDAGNSTVVTFLWDTTGMPESNNVVKANATVVEGETEIADNEYVDGTVTVTWKKVYISPTLVSENKPKRITITISIFNVTELWGWEVTVRWKRGLLWCEGASEGPFLSMDGAQDTWWVDPIIDNLASPPEVTLSDLVMKGGTPVNGSGSLANVTFSVTGTGDCVLELYNVKLRGVAGAKIPPHTGPPQYHFTGLEHGYFYTTYPVASFELFPDPLEYSWRPIVGEPVVFNASQSYDPDDPYEATPGGIVSYHWNFGDGTQVTETDPLITHVYMANDTYEVTLKVTDDDAENGTDTYPQVGVKLHDIALLNVTAYPIEVATGATVTINATVLNEGSAMEYLNITTYYDYTPIEERVFNYTFGYPPRERVTVSAGANATCTILWDTAGVVPGTYMIGAKVELIRDSGLFREVSLDEWEADKTDNVVFAGTVTILGTPVHDLAVTALAVDPTNVRFNEVPYISVTVKNEGNIDETFNATVYYNSTLVASETDVALIAGKNTKLTFAWSTMTGANTTQEGVYLIVANVTLLANETDTADNSRNITRIIRVRPYAKFTYSPTTPAAGQNMTFDASSTYSPGIPAPGGLPTAIIDYQWNFGDGTTITDKIPTQMHTYPSRGTYSVTLTVTDSRGLTGTFSQTVRVGHDHDVAVTDVTPLSTQVTSGAQVSVEVTVTNKGTANETITVSLYYDDTTAAAAQSVTLSTSEDATLTFVWNTADVAGGTYTLTATASEVAEETYVVDNTLAGAMAVTILKLSRSISLSASLTTLTVGGSTTLSGAITPARGGVDVTIWIKGSGENWVEAATVTSDANGGFSHSWTPPSAGSYGIKVSWLGDDVTHGAESEVQVVTVQEALTSNMFLYSTIAFAVLCGVIVAYFLWIRKPTPT